MRFSCQWSSQGLKVLSGFLTSYKRSRLTDKDPCTRFQQNLAWLFEDFQVTGTRTWSVPRVTWFLCVGQVGDEFDVVYDSEHI